MAPPTVVSKGVFARNLLANWFGLAVDVAAMFFLTPFIVRSLGLAAYGIWSLANTIVGYLGLVDMGIRGSVGRYINQYISLGEEAKVKEVLGTALAFLSAVSLAVLGVAMVVGSAFQSVFPKTPDDLAGDMLVVMPLLTINLWLAFVGSVFRSVLTSLDRFEVANGVNLAVTALRVGGVLYVLPRGYGLVGLVGVSVACGLLGTVGYAAAAKRIWAPLELFRWRGSRERFSEMWRFGLAAFATRSANQIVHQSNPIIIMAFIGPSAVGVYGVAATLVQNAQKLIDQVGGTIYPSVMRLGSLHDIAGLARVFDWYARIAFLFGILVYVGLTAFGDVFIDLWVGTEFSAAAPVAGMLALAELSALYNSTGSITLFSLDRIRFNLISAILEALSCVTLALALVVGTDLGMLGAAIGTLVPMLLFRGGLNPINACLAMQTSYLRYISTISARTIPLALGTYLAFRAGADWAQPGGWWHFLLATGAATVIYLIVGSIVLLGPATMKSAMRSTLAKLLNQLPPRGKGR